jgi:hypothetical protein
VTAAGRLLTGALAEQRGVVPPERLAMLGQRDVA